MRCLSSLAPHRHWPVWVELTYPIRRHGTTAICAFETFERRLESQLDGQFALARLSASRAHSIRGSLFLAGSQVFEIETKRGP